MFLCFVVNWRLFGPTFESTETFLFELLSSFFCVVFRGKVGVSTSSEIAKPRWKPKRKKVVTGEKIWFKLLDEQKGGKSGWARATRIQARSAQRKSRPVSATHRRPRGRPTASGSSLRGRGDRKNEQMCGNLKKYFESRVIPEAVLIA